MSPARFSIGTRSEAARWPRLVGSPLWSRLDCLVDKVTIAREVQAIFRYPIAALIYAALYHFAYVEYVSPTFDYAHLFYFSPSAFSLGLTYLLIAAPVVGYQPSNAAASYGASLIFAIAYVPAQLILLFNWQRSLGELATLQIVFAACMAALLWLSNWGLRSTPSGPDSLQEPVEIQRMVSSVIAVLTLASAVTFVYEYAGYMRFVALDDVYDLRFESAQEIRSGWSNYSFVFLIYCFLPFYWTVGVLQKKPVYIGLAAVLSAMVYSAVPLKGVVAMGPCIFAASLLFGSGRAFLMRLLVGLALAVLFVTVLPTDDGLFDFAKSLVLVRTIGVGGWTMSMYDEFFSNNPFTYYTHIGPINALTGAYPYGDLLLGQVIGLNFFGSEEANYNANFWASDGIAAFGVLGLPIVTAAFITVFYFMNRLTERNPAKLTFLWLCGFWFAILNAPLTTSLLSGGGLAVVGLLYLNGRIRQGVEEEGFGIEEMTSGLQETAADHAAIPLSPKQL